MARVLVDKDLLINLLDFKLVRLKDEIGGCSIDGILLLLLDS